MTGINYPVTLDDISKFEDLNSAISVNVFGFENEEVSPLRITKKKDRVKHVNLLLITNDEGKTHYCLIGDLARLLSNLTNHKNSSYYCNYCIKRFSIQTLLYTHDCDATDLTIQQSCYIPTPKHISHSKQGLINIKSNDKKSFLWSVLCALHGPVDFRNYTVERYRRYESTIDMTNISYPVQIKDLDRFEKLNRNISVNVFGEENNEVYPIRITKELHRQAHVNLMQLTNSKGRLHYILIKNLNHLLSNLTKNRSSSYYYCLHRYSSESRLLEHIPLCSPHGAQKTKLPTDENKWMYFKNYTLTHKVPFTIYCDFESFIEPIDTCHINPSTSSTTKTAKHTPSGFCYVIIDRDRKVFKPPVVYSGPNVVDTLLNSLMMESETLLPIIKTNVPMIFSREDCINFNNAVVCHLCKEPLGDERVANHDHLSGCFLGAAHNSCNLNYQVPEHIPVFFHNLRGYDCHHIMQGFGKFKKERISCIATTSERYTSVSLESLRFLDSLQFLNASLDTLVNNLANESPNKFHILRHCMGDSNLNLLLRKGVFCYDYMTGPNKFNETQLPAKEHFFNSLTETHISNEDYIYAQNVWDAFNMSTLKDYHDLYLKTDVLLLADVFENFRTMSITYYGIDPCNVYSSPGLAWNAMLKMTNIKLELLTDIDQHLFIESGIRGGVSMIPNRYAKANNPLLPDYDDEKPKSYILYLDCTNLYGTAMTQPLPISNFKWLTQDEIDSLDITNVSDDKETGYILEVDLQYPNHLHDLHSDYPLAPERMKVTENMLSPYCKKLLSTLNFKQSDVEKLLTTLNDKDKYILHYRNLKLYLELGLVLKKIHRVLSFKQSAWLKPFIDFNTEKRKGSKNNFEKDFFKLINNSTYGKSLENVRKHIDFKLVTNEKQLVKLTSSPRLKDFFPYNEELVGLTMKKQSITLNRPIYVGFSVLDISKLIMYTFHYKWAITKYGSKIRLNMTDTDSLNYNIQTEDVYKDMFENLPLFDTSDYPSDHVCYSTVNKKKLGTFKDEMNGKPIREIIGLRAKCYSILHYDKTEKKVAKGVPRVAIQRRLKHEHYKKCLFQHALQLTTSQTIRSDNHHLFNQQITKLSLTPYDDKRYILDNGVDTLAYGHYKTRKRPAVATFITTDVSSIKKPKT